MRSALILASSLVLNACVPPDPMQDPHPRMPTSGYNLRSPVALDVPDVTIPDGLPGAIKRLQLEVQFNAFKESIESLGGTVNVAASQRVALVVDQKCPTGEVGDVDVVNAPHTIRVCVDTYTDYQKLDWTIRHQLGHVLGAPHAPCNPDSVMSVYFDCFKGSPVRYTDRDKRAICAATICG